MIQPRWLSTQQVLRIHEVAIRTENGGGMPGLRDAGLLESALARPQQVHHYTGVDDIVALAVTYASGLTHNHVFFDGNKRVAFLAMLVFLELHSHHFTADNLDAERTMLAFAAGDLNEQELEAWVRTNLS